MVMEREPTQVMNPQYKKREKQYMQFPFVLSGN